MVDPTHYYVSARFPGDAEKFASTFIELLKEAAALERRIRNALLILLAH